MVCLLINSPVFSKDIKVGAAFSITGPASFLGEPERKTAEMIVEEINNSGGINGNKIKLFVEDTQGDNTRAVMAFKKLIEKYQVCGIVGTSRSGTSMAVIPIVQAAKIPMLSCAAAEQIVTPIADRSWVFKTPQNDSDAVRRIYDHIVSKGIKDIAIITGTSGFGTAGREQLKNLSKEYGLNIVADETFNPTDTDMQAQLVKIRNTSAKALINWEIVPAQSIIPQNMKQLKIEMPLYQSHGFGNIKYVKAAGVAAEGIIFPAGRLLAVDSLPDDHPQKSVLLDYKKKYEEKFKEDVSTFGGHAYDGMHLIANALKQVGDDPAKMRDYLETAKFVGTGGSFAFSPKDHCGLDKTAFEMLTVKDGKFVVLKE